MIYVYFRFVMFKRSFARFLLNEFTCVTGSIFCLDLTSRLRFKFEVVWPAPQVDVKKIERYTAF